MSPFQIEPLLAVAEVVATALTDGLSRRFAQNIVRSSISLFQSDCSFLTGPSLLSSCVP